MPRHLAACYVHMRRLDEARAIIRQLRALPAVVIPDTAICEIPSTASFSCRACGSPPMAPPSIADVRGPGGLPLRAHSRGRRGDC